MKFHSKARQDNDGIVSRIVLHCIIVLEILSLEFLLKQKWNYAKARPDHYNDNGMAIAWDEAALLSLWHFCVIGCSVLCCLRRKFSSHLTR